MPDSYEIVHQITSSKSSQLDNFRYLNDFAVELGWKPSDQLEIPKTESFAAGHLVVEHGLENSALITFLRGPQRFTDLEFFQRRALINASYNNLIDWHITVGQDTVDFLYNRYNPPLFHTQTRQLGRGQMGVLSSSTFDSVSAKHPFPNVPALDSALIKTISFWKKALSMEIPSIDNQYFSALFNGLILARGLEDHLPQQSAVEVKSLRALASDESTRNFSSLIQTCLGQFPVAVPETLWRPDSLRPFDSLDASTMRELVEDFYRNRFERYFDYDFSLMSKHALSRIYEHYVSLLRTNESNQADLFGKMPVEEHERSFGNFYTPEFVARFFAKYLRNQMPLSRFKKMEIADPACGSGIFLRSIVEVKSEALFQDKTTRNVSGNFDSVHGTDIDPNACAATRLSLSLLSLVLTNTIPVDLDIKSEDSLIQHENKVTYGTMDAVIANPPFVSIDELPEYRRIPLLNALGPELRGKADLYLGILKVSLDFLKEDGYGCFVLPKNFLLSENAARLRKELLARAEIRCVVDLSEVRVFEGVGAYVILLIFQKTSNPKSNVPMLVAQCFDLTGLALEDVLQERVEKNPAYEVYWSAQPNAADYSWSFTHPERVSLFDRFAKQKTLEEVADIRQGFISGADKIFIIDQAEIPDGEESIYVPFLPDRDIRPYSLPATTGRFVFHPFRGNRPLDEASLQADYPKTWQYLSAQKTNLTKRKSVSNATNPWWRPIRLRQPDMLLRPKIVTPHIVISPKFSLDSTGEFAVSHSPYIVPKAPGGPEELLFLLGILNSTPAFWYITQNVHTYSRGYSRLEVATLKKTPVPDITKINHVDLREIIDLVSERRRTSGEEARQVERRIDVLVADAYGLTEQERLVVGMGAFE